MINTISYFSSKFARVAELILRSEGPVFCFSNYVYYGVDSMGVIMDFFGFQEYPKSGPRGSYFVWKGDTEEKLIPKAKELFNSKSLICL